MLTVNDITDAFREACEDLQDPFIDIEPNQELRKAAEQYKLIKNVNELSKKAKYAI